MGTKWSQDGASKSMTEAKTTKVKLPDNYKAIIKHADSPVDNSSTEKLYNQLRSGVFLDQKRKKYWVDGKSNKNCFMLFARDLSITWGDDNRYWHWTNLQETSDVFVDVAELLRVCWLEISGNFDMINLSPGTVYEVVFLVMLKGSSCGWEVPVKIKLFLPDGTVQLHDESFMEKPRGSWIEILAGEFTKSTEKIGDIQFSLSEIFGGQWKSGLIIKGVVIRPKA